MILGPRSVMRPCHMKQQTKKTIMIVPAPGPAPGWAHAVARAPLQTLSCGSDSQAVSDSESGVIAAAAVRHAACCLPKARGL